MVLPSLVTVTSSGTEPTSRVQSRFEMFEIRMVMPNVPPYTSFGLVDDVDSMVTVTLISASVQVADVDDGGEPVGVEVGVPVAVVVGVGVGLPLSAGWVATAGDDRWSPRPNAGGRLPELLDALEPPHELAMSRITRIRPTNTNARRRQ